MKMKLFCILVLTTCQYTLSTSTLPPGNSGSCVNNYFQASAQTFYLNNDSTFLCKQIPEVPNDYVTHPGLGAYKLHLSAKTWNDARNACINDGAHLAVITSAKEEEILRKMQQEVNAEYVWLGVHEQYKKDDWVTVFDQPLSKVGFVHWHDGEPNNLNNGGEHCVCATVAGMNDKKCDSELWFFCKIDLK